MTKSEVAGWREIQGRVIARDRHRCLRCGSRMRRLLTVHHLKPRDEGGTNDDRNLATLCVPCHDWAEARHQIGRLTWADLTRRPDGWPATPTGPASGPESAADGEDRAGNTTTPGPATTREQGPQALWAGVSARGVSVRLTRECGEYLGAMPYYQVQYGGRGGRARYTPFRTIAEHYLARYRHDMTSPAGLTAGKPAESVHA